MSILKFLRLAERAPRDEQLGDTATVKRIVKALEAMSPDRARYLAAFAYLLGRMANADSHISEVETDKMREIVQLLGHLPEAQATLVVEIAKSQVRLFGGTEDFLVTREFRDIASATQRLELLECVFAVSAADASITVAEESQAALIARELGVSHDEFIAARRQYLEHIEALKSLRQGQKRA